MTLAELRDKADAKLATFWTALVTKEEAYFAKHGRYFGFNWSPSTEVVDGVDTNFVLNPPSRFFVAEDVSFPATTVPFQIQVIRHEGVQIPDTQDGVNVSPEGVETPNVVDPHKGHGFTATVRVKLPNNDVYTRSKGYGRYSEDRAWSKVMPTLTP
jgi:hypothetical protein